MTEKLEPQELKPHELEPQKVGYPSLHVEDSVDMKTDATENTGHTAAGYTKC